MPTDKLYPEHIFSTPSRDMKRRVLYHEPPSATSPKEEARHEDMQDMRQQGRLCQAMPAYRGYPAQGRYRQGLAPRSGHGLGVSRVSAGKIFIQRVASS